MELTELLGGQLLVLLPEWDENAPNMAALEVMVQQGITTFAWPAGSWEASAELRRIYAARARFGAYGIAAREHLGQIESAAFAFLDEGTLADACPVPAVLPALTPNEVREAARLGAGVCIFPAAALGPDYPQQLRTLLPEVAVIARGGISATAASDWFAIDAVVCLDDVFLHDALSGGSLDDLRRRCQAYLGQLPG